MQRAIPLFAILLFAPRVHADAPTASEPRSVPAFHGVDLAGTLDVEITLGKPASVQITGEADQLAGVITTVKDGILVIDTKLTHVKRSHLRAIVSASDLSSLALSGTGDIKVNGIANDNLAITVPGTGDIAATGSTGTLRVTIDGTGDLSAGALTAKDVTISVGGTGAATVNATGSLEARVTGTGSISVHGHPQRIKKSVTGTGSIHVER